VPTEFDVFSPKAIAGIRHAPAVLVRDCLRIRHHSPCGRGGGLTRGGFGVKRISG
jgi:hypothetical protein